MALCATITSLSNLFFNKLCLHTNKNITQTVQAATIIPHFSYRTMGTGSGSVLPTKYVKGLQI